jgi:hypothetical protein
MNTGMQDVANLAWKLAAVEHGAAQRLLDSYEQERGEVGRALLRFTERGLKLATMDSPLLEGVRDAVLPWISRLEPVQRAALGFVSETAIAYRGSSVVVDAGGDGTLRAGDRMPDFSVGDSTLLGDWTEPRHLAVLLDASAALVEAVRQALPAALVKAVHTAGLDEEGRRALGGDAKLLVVRPDGYVGFRGPLEAETERAAYARQDGLA